MVVVVVAIIGVVIVVTIIGVVVVVTIIGVFVVIGVSAIIKFLFVIIGVLRRIVFKLRKMVIPNHSSSGTKKYRGSNSSDGGNTRDGVKIAGGGI
ncbi:hypothetical protein Tco_0095241, partial [Tanacetum coccineum]